MQADVFCREVALARVGGDEEFLAEIIDVFQGDATLRVSELRAAVATGDARRLQRAAHSLKGAVGYLGAEPTLAAVLEVESLGQRGEMTSADAAVLRLETELQRLSAALAEFALAAQ